MADKVMIKALTDPATEDKRSMIVFLSNGRNNGGGDALYYVNKMNEEDHTMILKCYMIWLYIQIYDFVDVLYYQYNFSNGHQSTTCI